MRSRIASQSLRKNNPAALQTKLGFRFFGSSISTEEPLPRKKVAALWGNGDYGRLGLGGVESQFKPVVCSALKNESLRDIACGGAHTLFLTESGRVYTTGLNDFGQLGISNEKSYATEPLEVSRLPKEIVQISAGYHHSSAITVDGKLYMWGKNSNGQLGLGKRAARVVPVPSQVDCLVGISITMSALGSEHSVAVTEEGEVLSWGEGRLGRLGHDHESRFLGIVNSRREYTPRRIEKLAGVKAKKIAAGLLHTACIDENGSVYIFGEGKLNILGFTSNAATPSMVAELPFSEKVACGGYHTCVVTDGRELYSWGSNEHGCLGNGCIEANTSPEKVRGPFLKHPVCKVSCGWKHTAALSEGKIFAWGWGGTYGGFTADGLSSGGQLGQGDDFDYHQPEVIDFGSHVTALQVSCGFNHTGAILEYT